VFANVRNLAQELGCEGRFLTIGQCPAFLLVPPMRELTATKCPWVWYAPTFNGVHPNQQHRWMFEQFLTKGIAIAGVDVGETFGSPHGTAAYSVFYEQLHTRQGMSPKPCLLPQSRGGLMHYNWASQNAERVACIAGIFPVCDLKSYPGLDKACEAYGISEDELARGLPQHNPVDRLAPLAEGGVPILHVHGDNDSVVPLERNSGELLRRYTQLGGQMEVLVVSGRGHDFLPEFFQCQVLVDFVIRHAGRPQVRVLAENSLKQ